MYHEVVAGTPEEIHAVSVKQFTEQMAWLADHGYVGLSLEMWWALRENNTVPARTVVLTFDDGYRDNYTHALPILLAYAYRATVFITTEFIGKTSAWRPGKLGKAPLLSIVDLREIARAGLHIGSHTTRHRALTACTQQEVRETLSRSQEQILTYTGYTPISLAYPYSEYDAQIQVIAQDVGYELACTYRPNYVGGPGADNLALQRIGMLATDTLEDFSAKVRGAPGRRLAWYWRQTRHHLAQWVRPGGRL
jgi:peptidoglycan/xylan/chitin deacetylase (PgdA/CDA1 family)